MLKNTSAVEYLFARTFPPQDNLHPRFQGDERESGFLFYTQQGVAHHMTLKARSLPVEEVVILL